MLDRARLKQIGESVRGHITDEELDELSAELVELYIQGHIKKCTWCDAHRFGCSSCARLGYYYCTDAVGLRGIKLNLHEALEHRLRIDVWPKAETPEERVEWLKWDNRKRRPGSRR